MGSSRKAEISVDLEDKMGSWCGKIFVVLREPDQIRCNWCRQEVFN
jgi:hypothetical protein